jgi:hypothetical protein
LNLLRLLWRVKPFDRTALPQLGLFARDILGIREPVRISHRCSFLLSLGKFASRCGLLRLTCRNGSTRHRLFMGLQLLAGKPINT